MQDQYDIKGMDRQIGLIREAATRLKDMSGGIQAIERNAESILTFARLLELSLPDMAEDS